MLGIFGGAKEFDGVVSDAGTHGRIDSTNSALSTLDSDLNTGFGTAGASPPSGAGVLGWLRGIYNTLTGTLTVTVTNPTSSTVSVSNFPATQPVSGTVAVSNLPATQAVSAASLPLPSGASTSALQTTGNTSLSSLDTKTPALGQALAAASRPVVLPAAQVTALTPPTSVGVNNFPATQPVSAASLPLPAGAATEATLTSGSQKTQVTNTVSTKLADVPKWIAPVFTSATTTTVLTGSGNGQRIKQILLTSFAAAKTIEIHLDAAILAAVGTSVTGNTVIVPMYDTFLPAGSTITAVAGATASNYSIAVCYSDA